MGALSGLGIGLSLVSGFLLLALVAEFYYLLWWKKRRFNREIDEEGYSSPARELLYLFCWKKPSSLSSTALNPQEICCTSVNISGEQSDDHQQHKDLLIPFGEEGIEAELMRIHSLSGPPRFLFTIKEETKEDLESERSRKSSRGRSLSDVVLTSETPFMTPLQSPPFFTPPLTPLDCYNIHQGFNPLFESPKNCNERMVKSSPPPKFKFLRDAEEKLYKKTLIEEAQRMQKIADSVVASPSKSLEEEEGSFITLIIGKNREKGHQSSSQVNPLPSPPPVIRPVHSKLSSYLSSTES